MSSSSGSTHGSGMDGSASSLLAVPSLPNDALVQILSRLRAKSLCRSKCVSKPWRDLIAGRLCCKDLSKTLQGFLYFDVVNGSDDEGDGNSDGDGNGGDDGDGDADADDGDLASGRDEMLLRHGHGRFINLLGKPVPLLDPSFAFMKERPGVEAVALLDSCNGLLLFGHRRVSDTYDSLGYIVCNPVTEQWVAVPSSPVEINQHELEKDVCTFLIFDPSVSSHFDLLQFCRYERIHDGVIFLFEVEWVHTYSSITGLWSDRSSEWRGQGGGWKKWGGAVDLLLDSPFRGKALVNGMLHILIHELRADVFEIVAVDSQGGVCRVIEWPDQRADPFFGFFGQYPFVGFIGQSQGHLHCISMFDESSGSESCSYGMSIWVLEDYNTEEWVLKHSLSPRLLCEGVDRLYYNEFLGFHTDRNMMFFLHYDEGWKLISYDMDSRELRVLCTLTPADGSPYVTLYVPSLKSL